MGGIKDRKSEGGYLTRNVAVAPHLTDPEWMVGWVTLGRWAQPGHRQTNEYCVAYLQRESSSNGNDNSVLLVIHRHVERRLANLTHTDDKKSVSNFVQN